MSFLHYAQVALCICAPSLLDYEQGGHGPPVNDDNFILAT
jgi:hypothetical protein